MNILYVYAHPNTQSFNNLLKERALDFLTATTQSAMLDDLYKNNFNAVASGDDFNLSEEEKHAQYFSAQHTAYQKKKLSDDIAAEIEKVRWADQLIFQFPLWWFSAPAILKGWMDRVLVKGFAYDTGKMFENGLLQGKKAALVVTTQSPESAYQTDGVHQANIETFLRPIHHTLSLTGIKVQTPFVAYNIHNLDEAREKQIIEDYLLYLKKLVFVAG